MFNYGIGGKERPINTSEAIAEIPLNRTLLVQKLTSDPAIRPQIVTDLKTIDEVFDHYKPEQELEFEDGDGAGVQETLQFRGLADFGKKGLINQSKFLQDLNAQADTYQKLLRQLKSNKILKTALENPDAKKAYLAALQALMQEFELRYITSKAIFSTQQIPPSGG